MNPADFQNSSAGNPVRSPLGYWAFVPNPLPSEWRWTTRLIAALSDADRKVGELAGLGRSMPNPHVLVRPFVRREAVLSSRIEGTRASLVEVLAYEAEQTGLLETDSDAGEVYNYSNKGVRRRACCRWWICCLPVPSSPRDKSNRRSK